MKLLAATAVLACSQLWAQRIPLPFAKLPPPGFKLLDTSPSLEKETQRLIWMSWQDPQPPELLQVAAKKPSKFKFYSVVKGTGINKVGGFIVIIRLPNLLRAKLAKR